MKFDVFSRRLTLAFTVCLLATPLFAADTFRVAAYNVENYLDQPGGTRPVKSAEARAKVVENIKAINPDVISFEEMGSESAFQELRASLKAAGVDFPNWVHVKGYDTNIHVAVLSKFPITADRSHTKENFLLNGRRFEVSRGFAELDIKVNDKYTFTLLAAHLKSKRPVPQADEAELRLQEAKLLREKIDACLKRNPDVNLVVLGDFNDTKDQPSTKEIIGKGKTKLVDTRPFERNGDNLPNENPAWEPQNVNWTHYYAKEDSYSRIDYILLSPGMAKEWVVDETYVQTVPNWAVASDHRAITAAFSTSDK